jgi:succinate dehydrogenase/fumarate reductase-like Fe-S protein
MIVDVNRNGKLWSYEIPGRDTAINIIQALDYIYQHLDHTLAYYRHSACCQGVCGRCVVKANGKNVLACTATIEPGTETLLLEPVGTNVVRDLITET